MSAPGPESDPQREQRRHRGPLVGMAAVAVFGVALIVYWIIESAADTDAPSDPSDVEVPAHATIGLDEGQDDDAGGAEPIDVSP